MRFQSDKKIGLETQHGCDVGRDPREMGQDELSALGHAHVSPLQALRARCVDCCAGSADEVRKCTAVYCPSWPFRMGFDPWRQRRQLTAEQKEALANRLAVARQQKGK
jgi:hypothetical protein